VKAGYGFSSNQSIVGCPLENKYNGVGFAGMPANLVPLIITAGASGAPDSIRIIASNKKSFSVPIWMSAPFYTAGTAQIAINVASVRGVRGPILDGSGNVISPGNLMVAAFDSTTKCQMFQVTANPAGAQVNMATITNGWNPSGYPNVNYGDGSVLVNLGSLRDVTYSIDIAKGDLTQTSFVLANNNAPSYQPVTLNNNIVQLKALYGKDTNGDGAVDTWDTTTPTTNAGWLQVLAVRVAVLARSNQKEKDPVTFSDPTWDVGTTDAVTGATACGGSKCLSLKISTLTDWQYYRYKMFDTTIPLRNMLWYS
jgi:type IV pilus assembly protein PilW